MNILFLSRWFPFPANNGSKLRIASLLSALSREHQVTLVAFSEDLHADSRNTHIHSVCQEIHLVEWKPYNPGSYKALLGFFNEAPRFIVDTFSIEMALQIERCVQSGRFQAVIASQIDMASYAPYFTGLPAIFEELESGIFAKPVGINSSVIEQLRSRMTWYKFEKYIRQLIACFQAVTVVSEQERDILLRSNPGYRNVHVIPNCIDLCRYQEVQRTPEPKTLIYTGSFHYSANHDAMVWFTREIFPCILAQFPDTRLTITGDHANKLLPDMRNVQLTGFIDDIMPLVAGAWCSLAPIRIGGGTRLKILESMALGTPVVTTTKGAEGLAVKDGCHVLVADAPDQFAAAVIRLMVEPDLRQYLVTNSKALLCEKYDSQVVLPQFAQLVSELKALAEKTDDPRI